MMAAWHRGQGRDAFLQQVEERCIAKEAEWRGMASEGIPGRGWKELIEEITEVAKEHFEDKPVASTRRQEQEKRRSCWRRG